MNATLRDHPQHPFEFPAHLELAKNPSAEMMVTLLAPMLRRIARRYESDTERCTELQQEMLIALWLSLDTFERRSSFRTWVHSVAHNVGVQHIARRRVDREREQLNGGIELQASPCDPEALVAVRERALILLNLLSGLRPREREAVLLELQELEINEMSDAMKCSATQVRETLRRARRRLQLWMRRSEIRCIPRLSDEAVGEVELDPEPFPRRQSRPASSSRHMPSSAAHPAVYVIERTGR